MGAPTGGGDVCVDAAAIQALGDRITQVVGSDLTDALGKVTTLKRIEDSNFTATTRTLAVTYVVAVEFVEEQLKTAREHAVQIGDRLHQVARNWLDADEKSTIKPRHDG
jgi:hypothetical protein